MQKDGPAWQPSFLVWWTLAGPSGGNTTVNVCAVGQTHHHDTFQVRHDALSTCGWHDGPTLSPAEVSRRLLGEPKSEDQAETERALKDCVW